MKRIKIGYVIILQRYIFKSVIKPFDSFINIKDMSNYAGSKGGARGCEAHEVKKRVALVKVPLESARARASKTER